MNDFVDSAGRALSDYTRPSLTVDTAVLTVDPFRSELCVALVRTEDGRQCLPGTFIHEGETLVEAANRALLEKVHLRGLSPVQLHVFDSPGRDPRGWVISVAHIVVAPFEQLRDVPLTPVHEVDGLAYDHDEMLTKAVERLRADYAESPDPWNLLETFTLRELREVHEAIDPNTPLRDSFRRLMQPMVVDTGEMSGGSVGKPSRIWRKETEAERVQRKYAKYERPVSVRAPRKSAPRDSFSSLRSQDDYSFDLMTGAAPSISSLSSSEKTERNYVLEIEWMSGEKTPHESLSPSQASLRLREFEREIRAAWDSLPAAQRPRVARILTPWGDVENEVLFG